MKRRKHSRRDFWHQWHEQRDKSDFPHGHRHRRKRAQRWREHFHDHMNAWPEEHWAFGGRRFNPWLQGKDSFNPILSSVLSKGGGLLALFVLHLLAEKQRYGNELMELISEQTKGQWVANPGAIYPLMGILEKQGLVQSAWADPHKRTVRIYNITDTGREEMSRLKAILRPKLQEAVDVMQDMLHAFNGDTEEYI